jgi:hypothetical protein
MSLLSEAMTDCTILDKKTAADGYGGYTVEWTDGASFKAAITYSSGTVAKIAEKQGVTNLYTVTTNRAMNLQYYDVFRRESDGKIFRVTTDGDENNTPLSASLDMRQVSAEEWNLFSNG